MYYNCHLCYLEVSDVRPALFLTELFTNSRANNLQIKVHKNLDHAETSYTFN